MEQNDRLEKNKDFFQGKQLFNTKLLLNDGLIRFDTEFYTEKEGDMRCTNKTGSRMTSKERMMLAINGGCVYVG